MSAQPVCHHLLVSSLKMGGNLRTFSHILRGVMFWQSIYIKINKMYIHIRDKVKTISSPNKIAESMYKYEAFRKLGSTQPTV
jgi:hypothetical protein